MTSAPPVTLFSGGMDHRASDRGCSPAHPFPSGAGVADRQPEGVRSRAFDQARTRNPRLDPPVGKILRTRLNADPGGERHSQRGIKRSEEHTSELQSLMRTSYAVFCLKKKKKNHKKKRVTDSSK